MKESFKWWLKNSFPKIKRYSSVEEVAQSAYFNAWNRCTELQGKEVQKLKEALRQIMNHYDMDGYGDDAWKNLALEMAEVATKALDLEWVKFTPIQEAIENATKLMYEKQKDGR